MIVFARFVPTDELVQRVRASPIPIVIAAGGDPVRDGLVASLNRPRGNVTGVNNELGELSGKYLGLLRDLVPKAATIAALVDPIGPIRENIILRDARDATATLGQKLLVTAVEALGDPAVRSRLGDLGMEADKKRNGGDHEAGRTH